MTRRKKKLPAAVKTREPKQSPELLAEFRAKHGDEITFNALAETLSQAGGLTVGRMLKLPPDMASNVGNTMVDKVMKSVAPRDSLEQMLVEQLVFCHQRIQDLSILATRQPFVANRVAMNEQCNKAMTAYRRGFLALKQYRSQPATAATLTINQAEQPDDLVASRIRNSRNGSNELGAKRNGHATSDRC